MINGRLPFDEEPVTTESRIDARDRAGRERAVDPRFNVALEASAGTGKTRVLVDRYVNLLREGVDPVRDSGAHVHAQGCRRDARADHHDAAPGRRHGGRFPPRAGASCAIGLPMSRSARSTRSACRCSANSRSRPTWIPGFRWPTKPRCRGSWTSRSIARCASAGASRDRTSTSRSCSLSLAIAVHAKGWRRCSIAASWHPASWVGICLPVRATSRSPKRRAAVPTLFSRCSSRCAAVSIDFSRPVRSHPSFRLLLRQLRDLERASTDEQRHRSSGRSGSPFAAFASTS